MTPPIRSPLVFWSTRSRVAGQLWPPRFRTPSSSSVPERASSSATTIRMPWRSALRQVLTQPRLAGSMAGGGPSIGAGDGVAGRGECVSESGGPAPRRPAGAGMTAATPPANFDHLLRLTDRRGTFEHACFAEPRPEHGYCTDDMARVLVVATREPDADGPVNGLAGLAVRFLNEAQAYSGACRNRMDRSGRWTDEPTTDDHWGRCIWGLGTAAAHSDVSIVRRLAVIQFERAAQARSIVAACDGLRRTGSRRASLRRPRAPRGTQAHHGLRGFARPRLTATARGRGPSRDWPTRTRCLPRR